MISRIRKTKIAYLLKTFPKISETFILLEILALERKGINIQIFSLQQPSDAIFHSIIEEVRAKVTYIPSNASASAVSIFKAHLWLLLKNPKQYLRALRFIISRKEDNRFVEFYQAGFLAWLLTGSDTDHLHAHYASYPAGVAELVNIMIGLPYSFTAHAKDIYLSSSEVLNRKIKSAKFVITCTEYNKEFLQRCSSNGSAIYRIYHGLDTNKFRPSITVQRSALKGIPTILSIGRLREKKGFPYLIRACKSLKEKGYEFNCKIVGYGPLEAEIKQLIADLNLEKIVFLVGKLTQEEVIELYKETTIFTLPCQIAGDGDRDGIPNVLLEAMAMEVPVVSTDVSGITEIIDQMETGVLVPQRDAEALSKAIGLLLDNPILSRRLAKAGRIKVCEQFLLDGNTEKIRELFVETLKFKKR